MADPAANATDAIIAKIEGRLKVEYGQAEKEIGEKVTDYFKRFDTKNKTWQKWVAEGKKTNQEYQQWKLGQMAVGKRWEEMRDTIATDLKNTDQIARSIALGYAPEVYALNHDYGTFQVEKGSLVDTSYTLYNRQAAERLMRDDPDLLPGPGKKTSQMIASGAADKWNKQHIQSVAMQAILQGESIPDIATRLANAVGESNRKAAVRNARTMMTYAQNAGRLDAYKRANAMGVKNRKQWLATLDSRTRHAHRELDGQVKELNEPFENSIGPIDCPGDPSADGANVYNCRCTMLSVIQGHEIDVTDMSLRRDDNLEGMSYDEWKNSKEATSNPILKPDETAQSIKQKYIDEYKGFPSGSKAKGKTSSANTPQTPTPTQQTKQAKQPTQDTATTTPSITGNSVLDNAINNAKAYDADYHKAHNFDAAKWKSMPEEETAGVWVYTGASYDDMNTVLRKGDWDSIGKNRWGDIETCVNGATSALDRFEISDDTLLYRGMGRASTIAKSLGMSTEEFCEAVVNKDLNGISFVENAFCSTAVEKRRAWDKEVMMEVVAPQGTHGIYVDPVSRYPGEKEMLLQRGTRFEIFDSYEENGKNWLRTVIVDQEHKEVRKPNG